MWIVPSEFSKALDGLATLTGSDGKDTPNWLAQQGADTGAGEQIDTANWFDSNLPPAAEQPEAKNLRASDNDPASLAAQVGGPPSPDVSLPPGVADEYDPLTAETPAPAPAATRGTALSSEVRLRPRR